MSDLPIPLRIFCKQDEFIFNKKDLYFEYNKSTGVIKQLDAAPEKDSSTTINAGYSILGIIDCYVYKYLMLSSKIQYVGDHLGHKVYKIISISFIPFQGNDIHQEDVQYIQMLKDFITRNSLYYSETIDLTLSIKAISAKKKKNSAIFPRTIPHFCWNYSIGKHFDFECLNKFIFPVINGFFKIKAAKEYREDMMYEVIGRKDNRRSGMRFLLRGGDSNGNVANFVQTEEILSFRDKENRLNAISFEQIRGSIPLIWSQDPNFQLNPKIVVSQNENQNLEVFTNHLDEITKVYGQITIVNLIDKKKDQKMIGDCFKKICSLYNEKKKTELKDQFTPVTYVWFDFHSECKNMKYQNLSKLIGAPNIASGLSSYGYSHIKFKADQRTMLIDAISDESAKDILSEIDVIKTQRGVYRTNCIDCLDRTNVLQSVFARLFLHQILFELKLDSKPTSNPFLAFKPVFENSFKNLWADHGDAISIAYSGTPALKADFVRTGKRTLMGNLMDGYLSCKRLYINNLRDGYNQDCHDYFNGVIQPKKNVFKNHSMTPVLMMLGTTILISFVVYYYGMKMTYPSSGEETFVRCLYKYLFMIGSFALTFGIFFKTFRKKFVDFHTKYQKK